MTIQHGTIKPGDSSVDRSNHTIEGEVATANEAATLALAQTSDDRGRVVYQTGGNRPGWYLLKGDGSISLLAEVSSPPLNVYDAITDPDATDDVDSGYSAGSEWLNTATGQRWQCLSAGAGVAEWAVHNADPLTGSPTGFPNRTDSAYTFTDLTRTFSVAPTGVSFSYYVAGEKCVVSAADTVVWGDVEGPWWFYYDSTCTLIATQDEAVVENVVLGAGAFVAACYWDATNGVSIIHSDNRHGFMSGITRLYLHQTLGAQLQSGGALGDLTVDDTGGLAAHAQLSVEDSAIRNEDIRIDIVDGDPQDLAPIAQIPVFYRDGVNGYWRRKTADTFPFIYSGTAGYVGASGRVPYNEWTGATWQLTQLANNQYVLVHIFLTNSLDDQAVAIHGQATYASQAAASAGAAVELKTLLTSTGTIPIREFVPVGSLIVQTATGYTNAPKARFVSTDSGVDYVDWRRIRGIGFAFY